MAGLEYEYRGGGKSWAMRRKFVLLAMRYSGLKLLLLRRTMPELRENHILPLLSLLKDYAKYNSDQKAFLFPNGSRLVLGYCDNDGDCIQFQGQEYDVIGFEEATNFKEEWIRFISSCLRSTRTDFKPRIYYTCNPGNVSHAYIKRLFIDRNYIDGENPDDYVFIPAKVYDNKVLMNAMPDYVKQLEALPLHLRKAHLEGDWDVYFGQAFDEFRNNPDGYYDHRRSHVIEPFSIPVNWKIYRGYDFGYSKPWAVLYIAVSTDGTLYVFDELYGCVPNEPNVGVKMDVDTMAKYISDYEKQSWHLRDREIRGIADPAIWQKTTGTAVVEVLEKYGLFFDKGENKRIPSIQQIHLRLNFDEQGKAGLYFFKNCKNIIRTLPLLQYDEHKPEDIDTTQEDHCLVGNTLVWTSNGNKTIESMVGTSGMCLSSDGKYHRYENVRKTQSNVDVYKLTLEDGSTVTATPDHLFKMKDGSWKKLSELKEGDELWELLK